MSLAARRLQRASSLTNVNNNPSSDNSTSPKLKSLHSRGSNIPRPSLLTTSKLHPLVIKTPQAMTSDGCAPITIEELVSSLRILTHQHHKLPPQASFPLKTSSSAAKHHELKLSSITSFEHTPAKNTAMGNELKLDNCVSAVMLGFQSIDNAVKSTQFMYQEGKQIKFCSGEYTGLFKYLLDHFCCPNGTVSDMSCNPEGERPYVCDRENCSNSFARLDELYISPQEDAYWRKCYKWSLCDCKFM